MPLAGTDDQIFTGLAIKRNEFLLSLLIVCLLLYICADF
jgi:hypothetical protein